MATVCCEPVSVTQSKPQSPCLRVWGWTGQSAGSPTALAEAYLLSEIPHLPWERPSPLSRAGPGGSSRKLPPPLRSPSKEVGQAMVWGYGTSHFASTLSAHRGLRVIPGRQARASVMKWTHPTHKLGAEGWGW